MSEQEKEMTFLDHLEVLRWHIIRSSLAVVLLAIVAFIFKGYIFDHFIFAPKDNNFITYRAFCALGKYWGTTDLCIQLSPFQIINIDFSGQFSIHVKISIIAGFILGFPYVFWELWRFISPALYETERRKARGAVFYTSVLFLTGVAFGYFLIEPLTIQFFSGYFVSDAVLNQINLESYINVFSSVLLSCGVVFELPVLIYFLSKIGLVTSDFLKRYRRHALVVILTIAAVITPPDVFSQLVVTIPLMALYESGIFLAKRIEKQKLKQLMELQK